MPHGTRHKNYFFAEVFFDHGSFHEPNFTFLKVAWISFQITLFLNIFWTYLWPD